MTLQMMGHPPPVGPDLATRACIKGSKRLFILDTAIGPRVKRARLDFEHEIVIYEGELDGTTPEEPEPTVSRPTKGARVAELHIAIRLLTSDRHPQYSLCRSRDLNQRSCLATSSGIR